MNLTDRERKALLDAFAIDAAARADRIEEALAELQLTSGESARRSVDALASEVHSLRGAAATVALHSVAASAAELELAIEGWDASEPATKRALLVSAARFLELVRAFSSSHSGAAEGSVVRPPPEGEGPVVLHVEDNVSNLKLVERVLARRPEIRLAEARNGLAGVALAGELVPDLILLDLRLPDISGDEVIRRLRESETTREIPIVMISAEARPAEADRLLAAGVYDFLVKPIDVGTLLAILDRILARAKP